MFTFFTRKKTGAQLAIKIAGMHCTSCAMNIDGALEDMPGVIAATTSYAKSEVQVSYSPNIVSKAQILTTIEKLGYQIQEPRQNPGK